MKRISLYTDFTPTSGGGSANLRSWLPHLGSVSVDWFYSGPQDPAAQAGRKLGSLSPSTSLPRDLANFFLLWRGCRKRALERLLAPMGEGRPDAFWVVAHNAGVAAGLRLHELHPEVPLYVSVHDDPDGLFRRSRRYRAMSWLTVQPMRRLLSVAAAVDVTSVGMQRFYQRRAGCRATVLHPYVPELGPCPPQGGSRDVLRVGHVGKLYSYPQFAAFLEGVAAQARQRGVRAVVTMIGGVERRMQEMAAQLAGQVQVEFPGEMNEAEAVSRMGPCDLVYVGQPFDASSGIFRQTSFPTKLSTYVRAQRPIFAHAPADGTLAEAIRLYAVGVCCSSLAPLEITAALGRILALKVGREDFERLRSDIFGRGNVDRLEAMLQNRVWAGAVPDV